MPSGHTIFRALRQILAAHLLPPTIPHRIYWIFVSFLFLRLILIPNSTSAQGGDAQCTAILNEMSQSVQQKSHRQGILLARQYLTYCRNDNRDYAIGLSGLASALNGDNQHEEAVVVANRCLQTNDENTRLFCMYDKALGFYGLGRVQEAKTTLESGLRQPAITVHDDTIKQTMRAFLADVNTELKTAVPTRPTQPFRTVGNNGIATVNGRASCNGVNVGIALDIDGEIDGTTVESVSKLFAQYHERLDKVRAGLKCDDNIKANDFSAYGTHYGINSPGGSVTAAMAIGRMLRKERAWIMIPDDGVCVSACVLVLAGAVNRQIKGAKVGIHRPYLETTPQRKVTADQVKDAYKTMMTSVRAYLREMNVSERLANDMLAVEPENVRMLTDAELKSYGLLGLDAGEQQTQAIERESHDISAANQRGLDRREYNRRKALVTSVCGPGWPDVEWRAQREPCAERIMTTGR